MYEDPDTGLFYKTKQDADKTRLWTKLRRGELRPIEGFGRYTITPDGEVFNINRATTIKPHFNGHRIAVSLVNDEGKQKVLSLGRLVGHHFIPIPDDGQYYDIVFDDGNIENVHVNNLHWEPRWKRHANPDNYDIDIS